MFRNILSTFKMLATNGKIGYMILGIVLLIFVLLTIMYFKNRYTKKMSVKDSLRDMGQRLDSVSLALIGGFPFFLIVCILSMGANLQFNIDSTMPYIILAVYIVYFIKTERQNISNKRIVLFIVSGLVLALITSLMVNPDIFEAKVSSLARVDECVVFTLFLYISSSMLKQTA